MTTRAALGWVQWTLVAIGATLAIWCAITIAQIEYTKRMPVPTAPPLTVTQTLPGDEETPAATPSPTRGEWLARLEAPSVKMTATVLEGSDDGTLERGAGHIEDTALPGHPGNIGIAGHRDTIFRPLRGVKVGDALDLTTSDGVYHYRVTSTTVVKPTDVHVLDPTSEPTLTLVTCYPFEFIGHAPRRFIVQATRVQE